ncbi:MAG: hypothetical protein ABSH19_04595 [Opitutales bacterium]|jgi:hypothetical protein
MNPVIISLISACCIFGGALFGMWLQNILPKHHRDKESQDAIKLGIGIIATLTALVMGLLVSSAKSTFDTLNAGIVKASSNIIMLDRVLAHYGPEAQPIRADLRSSVTATIDRLWPGQSTGGSVLASVEHARNIEIIQEELRDLKPQNDLQRQSLAEAEQITGQILETRWLLIEEAHNQLPIPFLIVLVFWLTLIFISFGLFAPRHATVLAVMFGSALSMAAAIFLIQELDRPLDGIVRLSSAPMRDALAQLGQ